MSDCEYPLFPLSTVIFPGGVMPLRIFEPRYLDMVAERMRSGARFGLCAAAPPTEAHGFSRPRSMGTLVEIVDFDRLDDGALGITVAGRERYALIDSRHADDGLWWGRIEPVAETADAACPIEFAALKQIAAALIEEIGLPVEATARDYDSASWLSARLTELLPFDTATKHELLKLDDPLVRLQRIRPMVEIENVAER